VITVVAQVWLSLAIAGAVAVKGTFAFTPDGFVGDIAVAIARVSGLAAAVGPNRRAAVRGEVGGSGY